MLTKVVLSAGDAREGLKPSVWHQAAPENCLSLAEGLTGDIYGCGLDTSLTTHGPQHLLPGTELSGEGRQ